MSLLPMPGHAQQQALGNANAAPLKCPRVTAWLPTQPRCGPHRVKIAIARLVAEMGSTYSCAGIKCRARLMQAGLGLRLRCCLAANPSPHTGRVFC